MPVLQGGNANKATELGCRFVDANGFCYHAGATQTWCLQNPSDARCVDGGASWAVAPLGASVGSPSSWTPVANFALRGDAAVTGEMVSCSCMKNCGCTVRGSTNKCWCSETGTAAVGAGPWQPAQVFRAGKAGECFCKCEAGAPVAASSQVECSHV
jgi:hypothetical protein